MVLMARVPSRSLLVLITGLGTLLLTGCGGVLPELPLDDNLSREHLQWIEGRMQERGKQKTDDGLIARRIACLPPVWIEGRNLYLWGGRQGTGYWSLHRGPYYYGIGAVYLVPFPLPSYLSIHEVSYDFGGQRLWRACHRALLGGLLGGCGEFKHRDAGTVPRYRGGSCVLCPLVADLLPARWYFEGKEGKYWQVLWGVLGHISTDRSRTLVLLGYIPIRYWRAGPDAAPASR